MSQCHDPYDAIEELTVIDIAESGAPNVAQCHDSYESVGLTTADPLAVAAKAVETTKPVATTKSRPGPRGRIVVGVDGSGASRDALRWAARQAQLTGASLEAVMTWDIVSSSFGVPVPSECDPASKAKDALNKTVQSVLGDPDGLDLVPAVVQGPAASTLLQEAKGADLLVVGSRGHGALVGMLLGSVSEQCMAHATCPVVVVHESYHAA